MSWHEELTKQGYRISGPRRRIMELLSDTRTPLTPALIHKHLALEGKPLSLASVYRALDLLAELNLLCQVYFSDGSLGYMAHTGGHHHHVLCRRCNRSMEFGGHEDLDELTARVQAETGYVISEHLLQFYGLCPSCAALRQELA